MKIILDKHDIEYIRKQTGIHIGDGLSFTADVEYSLKGVGLYLCGLVADKVDIMREEN